MSYRTRRTRDRASVTMESFELHHLMDFMIGWLDTHPNGHDRWESWQDYVSDYALVRNELLASEWMTGRTEPPFAEIVYQRWGTAGPPSGTDVWAAVRSYRNLKGVRR